MILGDGICAPSLSDLKDLPSPILIHTIPHSIDNEIATECPIECAPFIYPMLDWSNEPLLAVIVTLGGCVVVPLCHALLWGVFRVRLALWKQLKEAKNEKKLSVKAEINIIEHGQHIGTDDNLVMRKVSNHNDQEVLKQQDSRVPKEHLASRKVPTQ